MPFYEYECRACGHAFEEFQKITDKPVRTCPECGSRSLRKLISRTSFVLKGSGWYVTDYARKDGGGKSAEKKTDTSSTKVSSSKDTDSKTPASTRT